MNIIPARTSQPSERKLRLIRIQLSVVISVLAFSGQIHEAFAGEMDGEWITAFRVRAGEKHEGASLASIKDGKFHSVRNGVLQESGEINVVPATDPLQYTVLMTGDGEDKGHVFKGIFSRSGDVLLTCVNPQADGQPPTEFKSTKENGFILVAWTRTTLASSDPAVPAERFNAVVDFISNHLIGKTIEARTTTTLISGKAETEFCSRTTYLNLVRTDGTATFDAVVAVKQKLWDINDKNQRTSNTPQIKDRILVSRYGIRCSKATGDAVGGEEVISSTAERPVSNGRGLKIWLEKGRLHISTTTSLYNDAFDAGGKYTPLAVTADIEFYLRDGKLHRKVTEKGFNVNPATLERMPTGRDTVLEGSEIESLF